MKYSELYDEKSTISLGTSETISLTDTFPNLFKVNEPIDTSIVYTTCKDNSLRNATIDIDVGANNGVTFVYDTILLNNGKYINKLKYAPNYQNEQFKPQYVLVNKYIPFWNGVNFDKTEVNGKNSQSKFVRNMKTNNMLFRVSLKGCYKTDISENYSNTPNVIDINLLDLINNPELYYITNISMPNPYVFYTVNGEYNNTTQDIKICLLNSTDTSTGIADIVNCIRIDPFNSSAPREVSFLSNKSGQKGNFLGGGDNEILYNMTKYYSVDTIPEFEMDFPNFNIDEINETTTIDYGIKKIAECENSIFCQYSIIDFNYNANNTPTTTVARTHMRLYRLLKGEFVVKLLAGAGLYFIPADTALPADLTPDNLGNYDFVCLGEMDADGYTTGRFIVGNDINTYTGYNKNGSTQNDNFDPGKNPGGYDDDNSDDINFGYMFSGAGAFTNLWYCTQKDLADLRQWFLGADAQHPIPEGFDPMPSIIGLFQYPISLGGDVLEEIKFRTSSGLIVSTGVQAARGLSTNLKFDLGSINIPARMRERGVPFLDYESTVECYVPFCGVFQLDTQTVIGKTLSCTLWMSPATGECNCIVYTISNGIKAPVAYGSGNMSSQIPISSNGWGSYAAALKNATIQKNQIISNAITGGVGSVLSGTGNIAATLDLGEQIAGQSVGSKFGAAGLALGGAGAALGLLSTGIKAYQDINAANVGIRHLKASNGTSINGAFSGQSAWNYPMTPYVKISRPHYKKPNNYAHTQGIPLVEAKKLSECSGFTMCVGADLTGITATQTERDIISAYLTNGIIV